MTTISSLSLQNVRCFAEPQKGELGKVTLLVGENNAGKSTFLDCYAAFAHLAGFVDLRDYRRGQQVLFYGSRDGPGEFGTIARDGADTFVLDGTLEGGSYRRVRFEFGARAGRQADLSERSVDVHFQDRGGMGRSLSIRRNLGPPETWQFVADDTSIEVPWEELSYREISTLLSAVRTGLLPFGGDPSVYRKRLKVDADRQKRFARLTNFLRIMPFDTARIAIRSVSPEPVPRRRQYNEDSLQIANNEYLRQTLSEVGQQLELFEDVAVQQSRIRPTYEVQVLQSARWRNLVDVGYGVHAILSILREISRQRRTTTFLLQQPEVQLHPSAQAALAQSMSESPHRFVIETHSDHLIDRFRICVMEGFLGPDDLKIVYFARHANRTYSTTHSMSVDKDGNLLDVPSGYREFFTSEMRRLLGFS